MILMNCLAFEYRTSSCACTFLFTQAQTVDTVTQGKNSRPLQPPFCIATQEHAKDNVAFPQIRCKWWCLVPFLGGQSSGRGLVTFTCLAHYCVYLFLKWTKVWLVCKFIAHVTNEFWPFRVRNTSTSMFKIYTTIRCRYVRCSPMQSGDAHWPILYCARGADTRLNLNYNHVL